MFWGLTIEAGKHYTQTVEESFHVSMVALDTRDVATSEREQGKLTQLMVQHEKAEFLVCTLCYGTIFQQSLDLNFTEGEEVTFFTEGRGTLHLTGYLVKDEPLTLDPDMMSLEEMSSSDDVASDSGDEDKMSDDAADTDDDDEDVVPSLQELAAASLEDEDDDNEDDEWKPIDKQTKRKKKQKKKESKRQHVDEPEPGPRKAKQLATLEMSKNMGDGSDSDESDDDFNPMDGALQDQEEDEESESEEDLLVWEEDSDEDDSEDDSEDEDALYDEKDSDYHEDSEEEEEDAEVVVRSFRNKQDIKQQLGEKSPRVLRAREVQSPQVSPAKSPNEATTAENKENRAGLQRLSKDASTPKTEKPKGNKTPGSKTPGGKTSDKSVEKASAAKGQAAKSKTPSNEMGSRTPGRKRSDGSTDKGSTPTAKTPRSSRGGQADQEGKNSKENQTPKSLKKDKKKDQQASKTPKKVKLPGGTVIEDLVAGDGKIAKPGKMVHVYYKGNLASNGKQFDSCLTGKPFMFRLGRSEVIKGWDVGVAGMKVGGERRITVPAAEGYGRKAVGPIPPNSTLVFNVTLKNVS